MHFRQLFYVGNVSVGPECVQMPPDDTFTCGQAVAPLQDGDVVISWGHAVGFGAGLLGRQANLMIDGHQAHLEVSDEPGESCEGADVAASLSILNTDHGSESVVFCSRGMSRADALATFERFIDSIDIGAIGLRLGSARAPD
jgi:hypothetical protein